MTEAEIRHQYYDFASKQFVAWANLYGTYPKSPEQARINPLWANSSYGLQESLVCAFYGHKLTSKLDHDNARYALMMIDLADLMLSEVLAIEDS
jgi:hypothetical protein